MRFLIVDNEENMLEKLRGILQSECPETEILTYTDPAEALEETKRQEVSAAFLDTEISGMTGLELAVYLKNINPNTHIIFVTEHRKYAVDAFAIHATGYLLKPVDADSVRRELAFIYGKEKNGALIKVQTFGGFEVYVGGQPVKFGRSKSKELFAYLVDHRGAAVTTGDAYAALFEDAEESMSGKSYFRTIVYEMKNALKKVGAQDVLLKDFNSLAVAPDRIDCDYYRFLKGDPVSVRMYQNDYMPAYSWAESKNAELSWEKAE